MKLDPSGGVARGPVKQGGSCSHGGARMVSILQGKNSSGRRERRALAAAAVAAALANQHGRR